MWRPRLTDIRRHPTYRPVFLTWETRSGVCGVFYGMFAITLCGRRPGQEGEAETEAGGSPKPVRTKLVRCGKARAWLGGVGMVEGYPDGEGLGRKD